MGAVAVPPRPELTDPRLDRPAGGRSTVRLGLLALLLATMFVVAVAVGSVRIPLGDVIAVLVGGEPARAVWRTIVLEVRLPRALTAVLAGAGLGVGGLQLQTLFRNPLAEPFILGISAGASLGVALVVLTAGAGGAGMVAGLGLLSSLGVVWAAAVGAAAVLVLVLAVSRRVRSVATILIIGLMVGYATSAIVSLLVYTGAGSSERLRAFLTWSYGSFRGTTWGELQILVPVAIVGLLIAAALVKQLNALLLGEGYAASMGVSVGRARVVIIASASLLTGVVTAYCGPIAFIGIAVPHLARGLLRRSDHRVLVPAVVLLGGVVALFAELVAQLPGSDRVLPLNAVTSLLGAPIVVAVLLRMRRASTAVVT